MFLAVIIANIVLSEYLCYSKPATQFVPQNTLNSYIQITAPYMSANEKLLRESQLAQINVKRRIYETDFRFAENRKR